MTIEVAHADEVCESKLFQCCRSRISNSLCGHHRFYQRFGQDEIRQPQGWKQNFGERTDVNSAACLVESRQGLERRSVIAIFTVIVIFNDECPCPGGPFQKLESSRNWEDYACRKLMRRSYIYKPDTAPSCRRLRDPNAMIVNRRQDQFSSRRHECGPRTSVVGLLHQHTVSRIQKDGAHQIQSLLRSVDNHNSVRTRINSAQSPEANGDRISQLPAPLRRAIVEIPQAGVAGACAEQPAPKCIRQIAKCRAAGPKIILHV